MVNLSPGWHLRPTTPSREFLSLSIARSPRNESLLCGVSLMMGLSFPVVLASALILSVLLAALASSFVSDD